MTARALALAAVLATSTSAAAQAPGDLPALLAPEEAAKTEASRDAGGAGRGNDRASDIWKQEALRATGGH